MVAGLRHVCNFVFALFIPPTGEREVEGGCVVCHDAPLGPTETSSHQHPTAVAAALRSCIASTFCNQQPQCFVPVAEEARRDVREKDKGRRVAA